MAVSTVEDLLALLDRSKLLTAEQFAQAGDLAKQTADPTTLAKGLAHEGLLSRWQAAGLLAGRSAFFLGKYKLIELLGRGGMGSVFLAEHTTMSRRVALKVVPRSVSQDKASLDRFFAEARAIAALDHPNIVQAYSVDNECDRYFIVMEYVDGMDLERMVEAQGRLDFARAADYIRQAADGLAHAHARKMIHCDIKPSNLLVNQQGVLKILDMGLARLKGEEEEPSGRPESRALGTVDYLSPEQALETPDFDHRADIYSLGCTLYFLLTGHAPFPEGTLPQRILKHQTQEPRDILDERAETPAELAAICRKMMAKRPEERFQSADEVSGRLAGWQPPVQPSAPPLPLRKAKPLEEDLPDNISISDSWWNSIVSTPVTSSGSMRAVKGAGGDGTCGTQTGAQKAGLAPATPGSSAIGRNWLGTRRRKIVAGVAAGTIALAALAAALAVAYRHKPKEKEVATPTIRQERDDPAFAIVEPNVAPESETTAAQKTESKPVAEPAKTEKSKTRDRKTEQRATEKPPPERPTAEAPPKEKPTVEQRPTEKPKVDPPKPPVKPEPKTPEAKPKPEVKPEQAKKPETPLAELSKTVDLPEIDVKGPTPPPFSLGKVYLEGGASLELQLLSGKAAGRGRPKFTLRSQEGGKHQWLVQAEPTGSADRDSPADVARLWLEKQALNFQWLADAAEVRADHLRNCGLVLAVGAESRFLPLRNPKEVEPLSLDLDRRGKEKEQNERSLLDDHLPDTAAMRMQLVGMGSPFPAHKVRSGSARKAENAVAPKGKVDILFSETKLSPFAVRIAFDVKQGAPIVQAVPMFNYALYKPVVDQLPTAGKPRPKRHVERDGLTPFLPGDAVNIKASLVTLEKEMQDGMSKLKEPQRKVAEARLVMVQERLRQINALFDAVQKTAVVQFRVYTPVDEEHEIDLFRTRPLEHKVAHAGK